MEKLYILGGSPCSGKSSIAEKIAEKFEFAYFKVDDYLEKYMGQAAAENNPFSTNALVLSPEETWMRNPKVQAEEELEIYREMFSYIWKDLCALPEKNGIITEGAAFLPELVSKKEVDKSHYINITPTREFQIHYYSQRPWIPLVLEGCSDKDTAFSRWMDRDALFGEWVREDARRRGYPCMVTDGSVSIEKMTLEVCRVFGLA